MREIFYNLYKVVLMPYLERDKYFEQLADEMELECFNLAREIQLFENEG
jgi:hypothetical protein